MSGIMNRLFGSFSQGPQNQQTQTQQVTPTGSVAGGGISNPGSSGQAANGVVPTGANPGTEQQTQQQQENKTPLGDFANLWKPDVGPDGKPITVTKDPLYSVDPNQVREAASKTDFKSVATPEQLAKVAAGGQEGVAAMMDIMQSVASSVYANAAVAATKIAEHGITKALSQAEQQLPGMIRKQAFSESLANKNPALQDPAVKPMIALLENQFAQKFPNATAQELTQMAEQYMTAASEAFNPAKAREQQQQQQQQKEADENWDRFFGEQPGGGSGFNI